MAEPRVDATPAAARGPEALVLRGEEPNAEARKLAVVLDFFGVPWRGVTRGEIARAVSQQATSGNGWRILAPAALLAQAMRVGDDHGAEIPRWLGNVESFYVYDFGETEPCRRLLRLLTGDSMASIRQRKSNQATIEITTESPGVCGPFSGLQVAAEIQTGDRLFHLAKRQTAQSIVRVGGDDAFLVVRWHGVDCYLNASGGIIDLDAPAAKYFDVRQRFCESVPLVMYVKSALRDACWEASELSACVTVDDPPLRPRYGFLHFGDLINLMRQHGFTSSVAFIPWNWKRTEAETVALFRHNSEKLSLSVHGCDHTGGEFAERSPALLGMRCRTALHRMNSLQWRTSLRHDNVMVFPQGAFSPEAGRALKLSGFDAAVNTEVAPAGGVRSETRVRDLWDTAIMRYGTFPIFTRRYIGHGIENFAFDGLLGKPCFIVAHHDTFRDSARTLAEFVDRLNALQWTLRWRSLGEAIQRSYKVRRDAGGNACVQLFSESLQVANEETEACEVTFRKLEGDPDRVRQVTVNEDAIGFVAKDDSLTFRVKLKPLETTRVRILYENDQAPAGIARHRDGLRYDLKVWARRYLSEFRDNYVSLSKPWYPIPNRFRHS